jgi:hypothetical protein
MIRYTHVIGIVLRLLLTFAYLVIAACLTDYFETMIFGKATVLGEVSWVFITVFGVLLVPFLIASRYALILADYLYILVGLDTKVTWQQARELSYLFAEHADEKWYPCREVLTMDPSVRLQYLYDVLDRVIAKEAKASAIPTTSEDKSMQDGAVEDARMRCPRCGKPYRLEDYRTDVAHIFCAACKSELPRR